MGIYYAAPLLGPALGPSEFVIPPTALSILGLIFRVIFSYWGPDNCHLLMAGHILVSRHVRLCGNSFIFALL